MPGMGRIKSAVFPVLFEKRNEGKKRKGVVGAN
jgi:hypothetical protein